MNFRGSFLKFRVAEYAGWSTEKMEKIISFVKNLHTIPDVNLLSPLLTTEKG